MSSSKFTRRRFISSLFVVSVLARCKKDITKPTVLVNPVATTPPVSHYVPTSDYLAQYGITEMGPNLMAPDPTFNQTLNGYTDNVSYSPGDTVNVYLSGPANPNSVFNLFDTQRKPMLSVSAPLTTQTIKSSKPWVDGFMYNKTFSFTIPSWFKSGIYSWQGIVPFVCKTPNQAADITVVYPSNTINAYNPAGGKCLYSPDDANRSTVLSFLRSQVVNFAPFYQWIDQLPYTVNYVADSDLEDYSAIANSKIVIVTGHSEYWTRQARQNIDQFVDSGKNLLMLSGNNMWWQIRYNQSKNMMICYKSAVHDPLSNTIYSTDTFSAPVVDYPVAASLGADYNEGGYGQTLPNRWNGYKIVQENSPLFKGAGLKNGDILKLKSTEYDCVPVVKMIAPGSTEIPVIDNTKLNFHKVELLAYDFAQNLTTGGNGLGLGTFIVGQKAATSGVIVNAASMDWTNYIVYEQYKTITKNMIDLAVSGGNLFTA